MRLIVQAVLDNCASGRHRSDSNSTGNERRQAEPKIARTESAEDRENHNEQNFQPQLMQLQHQNRGRLRQPQQQINEPEFISLPIEMPRNNRNGTLEYLQRD